MIGLSRFRRDAAARGMLAALLVIASGSAAACIPRQCSGGTDCDDEVDLFFDGARSYGDGRFDGGTLDGGAPADSVQIDIAAEMNQTFVTIQTCWLTLAGTRQLVCELQGQTWVVDANPLRFPSSDNVLRVTMSMNGVQLSQQTVSPTYVTRSCACGGQTSSVGTVHIPLPSP